LFVPSTSKGNASSEVCILTRAQKCSIADAEKITASSSTQAAHATVTAGAALVVAPTQIALLRFLVEATVAVTTTGLDNNSSRVTHLEVGSMFFHLVTVSESFARSND
jgi:hypothetical protein